MKKLLFSLMLWAIYYVAYADSFNKPSLLPYFVEDTIPVYLQESSATPDEMHIQPANLPKRISATSDDDIKIPTLHINGYNTFQDVIPDKLQYKNHDATTELWLYSDGVPSFSEDNPSTQMMIHLFLHVKKKGNWSGTFYHTKSNIRPAGTFTGTLYYYQEDGSIRDVQLESGTITTVQFENFTRIFTRIYISLCDNWHRNHQFIVDAENAISVTDDSSDALVALNMNDMITNISRFTGGIKAVPVMFKSVVKSVTDAYYFDITLQESGKTLVCKELLGVQENNDIYNYTRYSRMYKEGDTVVVIAHIVPWISHSTTPPTTQYGYVHKCYPRIIEKTNPVYNPHNYKVSVDYGFATLTWDGQDDDRYEVDWNKGENSKTSYTNNRSFTIYRKYDDNYSEYEQKSFFIVRAVDNDNKPLTQWSDTVFFTFPAVNPYRIRDFAATEYGQKIELSWHWDKVPDDCWISIYDGTGFEHYVSSYSITKRNVSLESNMVLSIIIDNPGNYKLSIESRVNGKDVARYDYITSCYGTDYTPENLTIKAVDNQLTCSWQSSANTFDVVILHYGNLVERITTDQNSITITAPKDGAYNFYIEAYNTYLYEGKKVRSIGTGTQWVSHYAWVYYYDYIPIGHKNAANANKHDGIYYTENDGTIGYVNTSLKYIYYVNGVRYARRGMPQFLFAKMNDRWGEFRYWENEFNSQGRIIIPVKPRELTAYFDNPSARLRIESSKFGYVTRVRNGKKVLFDGDSYMQGTYSDKFEVHALKGYKFVRWSDHSEYRYDLERTIFMDKDYYLTPFFTIDSNTSDESDGDDEDDEGEKDIVTLKVISGSKVMGQVNEEVNASYESGSDVVITATPKQGYHFTHWNDSTETDDTALERTIHLTQDTVFTAHFAPDTISLTVISNNELYGTVNSEVNGKYIYGSKITLQATATDSTVLIKWSNDTIVPEWQICLTRDTIITAFFELKENVDYTPFNLTAVKQPSYITPEYGGHVWSGNISLDWEVQYRAPLYKVELWYLFTNPDTGQDDIEWYDEWETENLNQQILLNEDSIWTFSVIAGHYVSKYDEEKDSVYTEWEDLSDYVWCFDYFFTRVDTLLPFNMTASTEDSITYHLTWEIKLENQYPHYAINLYNSDMVLIKNDTTDKPEYTYSFCREDTIYWNVRPLYQESETAFIPLTYQWGQPFRVNPSEKTFEPSDMQYTLDNDTVTLCWEGDAPGYYILLIYNEDGNNEYDTEAFTNDNCIQFTLYDRGEYTWYIYPVDELEENLCDDEYYDTFIVSQLSRIQYELHIAEDDYCIVNDEVNGLYDSGIAVQIEATPIDDYEFVKWSDGDTSNPRIILMNQDIDIYAITDGSYGDTYTVRFYDWDDTLLKTELVNEGEDATPPEDPHRDGYTFVGWDDDYTDIQYDIDIYALYVKDSDVISDAYRQSEAETQKIYKIYKDGTIYIIRPDGKRYTIVGVEI